MARSDYGLIYGCLGACDTYGKRSGSDWLAGPLPWTPGRRGPLRPGHHTKDPCIFLHHTDPGPT
ncbi:hypothetical protein E2C01_013349 [Portunus trituberculatus]|uniref:Uncharacterized protein n=1 Tax=Portunus trituberculatus TaxID=210409 RepID=A0A5B7DH17_PORTR|nr:hypothetical protein [Portunus trituberculatus]